MRFFYIDPGLLSNTGHHATVCQSLVREFTRRDIATTVLAHCCIDSNSQDELEAVPWFKYTPWSVQTPYPDGTPDALCGWLQSHDIQARTFADQLSECDQLAGVSGDDLCYFNSVRAEQLRGAVDWLQRLDAARRPAMIFEFGLPMTNTMDPTIDATQLLLRYVSAMIPGGSRVYPSTFDEACSAAHTVASRRDFFTLPAPQEATTSAEDRSGKRELTISILGQQGVRKGFAYVPELVAKTLKAFPEVRFLIHDCAPGGMEKEHAALKAIKSDRVCLERGTADKAQWADLLSRSDLILCPYIAEQYWATCSALAHEALANSIPLVVPAGCSLESLIGRYSRPGLAFPKFTPKTIFETLSKAIETFDDLAAKAHFASKRWAANMGPKNLADAMLKLASKPAV